MNMIEARDTIFKIVDQAWSETGYMTHWSSLPAEFPDNTVLKPWARIWITHEEAERTNISSGFGRRMVTRKGLLNVHILVPVGNGTDECYELAQIVLDAINDSRTDVIFRFANAREMRSDGIFEQMMITSIFEYDEFGG